MSSVPLGPGLHVLERGWLSSNNILLDDGDSATLIDSGHCVHATQTVALLRERLGTRPLHRLINTHLHSDHCGGNAALQHAWRSQVVVPSGSWQTVQSWDEGSLSYAATRQRCDRFSAQGRISAGEALRIGERDWQVLAAPGHDPESVMLFDERHGVLISADALWENGFGLVFPELDGVDAFDEVQHVLDLIDRLPVRSVIPGHGAAFGDVDGALQRARARLAGYRADPPRHLRHAARVLVKYHVMEERQLPLPALRAWLVDTPLLQSVWARLGHPEGIMANWSDRLLQDLLANGVLHLRDDTVHDV